MNHAPSSQWKSPESPRPKETRPSRSNVKVFLTFYLESVIHNEYAPAVQTVTKEYYIEIFRRLTGAVGINGCSCEQVVSGSFIMRLPTLHFCLAKRRITQHFQSPTAQIWIPVISGFCQT